MVISIPSFATEDSKASKIFFLNNDFGGFVKGNNVIALTNNAGQTWEEIIIETDENIQKLLFTSEDVGWLTADSTIYKSTDGGLNWSENATLNLSRINSIEFINSQYGYVYGMGKSNTAIYFTNNGGDNWIQSPVDSFYITAIGDVSFANDTVGVANSFMEIIKTVDGGQNWFGLKSFPIGGDGQRTPEAIKMLDENKIMMIGWEANVVAQGYIEISKDGGLNWEKYGNGKYFKWGIENNFILNEDSLWLTTNDGITYFTKDSGNNWEMLDVKLDEFCFTSNTTSYGIYDKYILHTSDGWQTYNILDSTITDINEKSEITSTFKLLQNYPNPFNPSTTIKYSIPKRSNVMIKVFDLLGREVALLVNKEQAQGNYEVKFDGSVLTSGIYFYRLQVYTQGRVYTPRRVYTPGRADNYIETKKMLLMK